MKELSNAGLLNPSVLHIHHGVSAFFLVRTYQDFCDRNLKLKKREDELLFTINELECKMAELNESLSQTLQVPHIEDGIS